MENIFRTADRVPRSLSLLHDYSRFLLEKKRLWGRRVTQVGGAVIRIHPLDSKQSETGDESD